MKETLYLTLARKMQKLLNEERIPASTFSRQLAEELEREDILLCIRRGMHQNYLLRNAEGLRTFLAQRYDFHGNLDEWIEMKTQSISAKRSEQVAVAGNSKLRQTRTFKGFLVNSYAPIEATLAGESVVIQPLKGTSVFLEDYEHFRLAEDVVVVGIENGENFHCIHEQQYLFEGMKVLFVSRYPQSKDLRTWLQMIPNRYFHFGDFDLAGVHIFLTEFYAYLQERAEFFIPADVEERLQVGSRELYDKQYNQYKQMTVTDERLLPLVRMIHQYKRGYEQEGYIMENR